MYRESPKGMPTVEQVREREANGPKPLWQQFAEGILQQAIKSAHDRAQRETGRISTRVDVDACAQAVKAMLDGSGLLVSWEMNPFARNSILTIYRGRAAIVRREIPDNAMELEQGAMQAVLIKTLREAVEEAKGTPCP